MFIGMRTGSHSDINLNLQFRVFETKHSIKQYMFKMCNNNLELDKFSTYRDDGDDEEESKSTAAHTEEMLS